MGFSDEDQILMENVNVFKSYAAKKLRKKFLNKDWGLWELNKLFKKATRNWHEGKIKWQH